MLYLLLGSDGDDNHSGTVEISSQLNSAGFGYEITIHESGSAIKALADLSALLYDAETPHTIVCGPDIQAALNTSVPFPLNTNVPVITLADYETG